MKVPAITSSCVCVREPMQTRMYCSMTAEKPTTVEKRIWKFLPSFVVRQKGYVPLEEYKTLAQENGDLRSQLNSTNALVIELKLILGIRTEIEELEKFLWPSNLKNQLQALSSEQQDGEKILTSQDVDFLNSNVAMEFRNCFYKYNMSVTFFIQKRILPIYSQTSAIGAHKIILPNRKKITPEILENVVTTIGLNDHTCYVSALQLI